MCRPEHVSQSQSYANDGQDVYHAPAWLRWHAARFVWTLPARLLNGCVRLYQLILSPLFRGSCRFYPSCSQYYIQAVRKYGAVSGSLRGAWRILRCQPFHPGGYDPP